MHTIAPEYNRKHSFVRRYELNLRLSQLKVLQQELSSSKQTLNRHLTDLYSSDVIDEWFDLYLTPIFNQINTTFNEFLPARSKTSWERRPLI